MRTIRTTHPTTRPGSRGIGTMEVLVGSVVTTIIMLALMGFFDALRAESAGDGVRVTTITPGFIQTKVSENALNGDGSRFGQTDKDIANGMDVTRCAEVIMDGFRKGRPEIPVGEGMEMKALVMKRFFPRLVFKKVQSMAPQ